MVLMPGKPCVVSPLHSHCVQVGTVSGPAQHTVMRALPAQLLPLTLSSRLLLYTHTSNSSIPQLPCYFMSRSNTELSGKTDNLIIFNCDKWSAFTLVNIISYTGWHWYAVLAAWSQVWYMDGITYLSYGSVDHWHCIVMYILYNDHDKI